jgi:aldehyde:ferredoxin oxidoreductase
MHAFWEATLAFRKMGMDHGETSACIELLLELYHEGIISAKETGGVGS